MDVFSLVKRPSHLLLAATAGAVISVAAPGVRAETLTEALSKAYAGNPQLAASRAAQRAVVEEVAQAVSGYRPSVVGTVAGTKEWQSVAGREQDENQLNLSAEVVQPLFRGLRTINSVRSADARVLASWEELRGVENDLLLATATAYMDVLRDEAVLQLNRNQVRVLEQQLQASEDRFEVGDVTRTDVAQSEARLAIARANTLAAEAQLTVSQEAYRRLVGNPPADLEPPPPLPKLPEGIDESVALALELSPDLNAARYTEDSADYQVRVAKGGLLPSLDAIARYTRQDVSGGDEGGFIDDFAFSRDSTIKSVGAQLTIPLYQSGSQYSVVRQARQVQSQRLLEIAVVQRNVLENIRAVWDRLRAARATIASTRIAVDANELALEGVRQEQMVGSRTILDVLDAEQELLDARVTLVTAERDAYIAGFTLLGQIGVLTAEVLDLPVEIYNPAVYYDENRNRWFGWSDTTWVDEDVLREIDVAPLSDDASQ